MVHSRTVSPLPKSYNPQWRAQSVEIRSSDCVGQLARQYALTRWISWRATGQGKQPYAIAMKDGSPFGIAALWENWRDPATQDWVRTLVVLTTASNDLVARIHDRMPVILKPSGYERWLGLEPDPRDLLVPFPSEPMTIWPISRRVNAPDNDDERLLEVISPSADIAVYRLSSESTASAPAPIGLRRRAYPE